MGCLETRKFLHGVWHPCVCARVLFGLRVPLFTFQQKPPTKPARITSLLRYMPPAGHPKSSVSLGGFGSYPLQVGFKGNQKQSQNCVSLLRGFKLSGEMSVSVLIAIGGPPSDPQDAKSSESTELHKTQRTTQVCRERSHIVVAYVPVRHVRVSPMIQRTDLVNYTEANIGGRIRYMLPLSGQALAENKGLANIASKFELKNGFWLHLI